MKMKDVFELPIKRREGGVMPYVENNEGGLICVAGEAHADAIINAVNLHDEMYEALEISINRLEAILCDNELGSDRFLHVDDKDLIKLRELLAKARGEK